MRVLTKLRAVKLRQQRMLSVFRGVFMILWFVVRDARGCLG